MPVCSQCGTPIGESDRFCQECGRVANRSESPSGRGSSRRAAIGAAVAVMLCVVVLALVGSRDRPVPVVYATEDGIYRVLPDRAESQLIRREQNVRLVLPSPNGRWVAYVCSTEPHSDDPGTLAICDMRGNVVADYSDSVWYSPEWAPDSACVAAVQIEGREQEARSAGVFLLRPRKEAAPDCVVGAEELPVLVRWSPDGRAIAFCSFDNAREEAGEDPPLRLKVAMLGEDGPPTTVDDIASRTVERKVVEELLEWGAGNFDAYEVGLHSLYPSWLNREDLVYRAADGSLKVHSILTGQTQTLLSPERCLQTCLFSYFPPMLSRTTMCMALLKAAMRGGWENSASLEVRPDENAHFFRVASPPETAQAVLATGDVVIDVVNRSGDVLQEAAADEHSGLQMVFIHSREPTTHNVRVRPRHAGTNTQYSLRAICDGRVDREWFSEQAEWEWASSAAARPTSMDGAWPVWPRRGGLWAEIAPLSTYAAGDVRAWLVAPFPRSATPIVWDSDGTRCAFGYTATGSPDASEREAEACLATMTTAGDISSVPIDALRGHALLSLDWTWDGAGLLVVASDFSEGETTYSLWQVPQEDGGQVKQIASEVECLHTGRRLHSLRLDGERHWLQ